MDRVIGIRYVSYSLFAPRRHKKIDLPATTAALCRMAKKLVTHVRLSEKAAQIVKALATAEHRSLNKAASEIIERSAKPTTP